MAPQGTKSFSLNSRALRFCVYSLLFLVVAGLISVSVRDDLGIQLSSKILGSQQVLANNVSTTTVTVYATPTPSPEPTYRKSLAPSNTPQLKDEQWYADVMVGLGDVDPQLQNDTNLSHLRYTILCPTFRGHFDNLIRFINSYRCLVSDYDTFDFHVIVSDSVEVAEFQERVNTEVNTPCPWKFGPFHILPEDQTRPMKNIQVHNMYDLLPASLQAEATPEDTSPLLNKYGKYLYQGLKKLQAARVLQYDWALWLDSDAVVVQPFRLREVYDDFVKEPIFWRSRIAQHGAEQEFQRHAVEVLGRDTESFGGRYYTLEDCQWIVEREIILDMISWVEAAHGKDFYDVFLGMGPKQFEISIYITHIHSRKLETTNSIFSKYRILETERELIRFGAALGFPHISHHSSTGFFESIWLVMHTEGLQPALSAMLDRWHVRMLKFPDLNALPKDVTRAFLLKTPIYMLVCGAPDDPMLHEWWDEAKEDEIRLEVPQIA